MKYRKYGKYGEYKDSGITWLGQIPERWELKKLKHLGDAIIGLTYSPDDVVDDETQGTLVLRSSNIQNQRLAFSDNVYVNKTIPDKLRTQSGDILICARNGSRSLIGKNALIDDKSAGLTFGAFMSLYRSQYNGYLSYVFNSDLFEFQSASFLTSTINQLTTGNLNSFEIPFPSLSEQRQIASFLDRETGKIDTLIAKQQQLISLLQEKRQAVISHAVTKGLNPNAKMKDSNVEWFGHIPEHWTVKRLGWICNEINDINHVMPQAVDEGVLFLSAKDLLDDGTLNFTENVKKISHSDYIELSKKIKPRRNDIIYSRIGARLGKARLVETDVKFLVSYSCCVVRVCKDQALPTYIAQLLDTDLVLTEAKSRTVGIGVPDLGLNEIARFPIPLPPKNEQLQIVNHLIDQNSKYKKLIDSCTHQVSLLQERRTALISAAVTGKIDVRESVD